MKPRRPLHGSEYAAREAQFQRFIIGAVIVGFTVTVLIGLLNYLYVK